MDRNMSANIAGLAGGLAMIGLTQATRKFGLVQGEPLPDQALRDAGVVDGLNEVQKETVSVSAHMGFAMSSALLYSRIRKYAGMPGPLAGSLFGVALWGASMAGITAMVGLRDAPWKEEEAKTVTQLVAHILFGLVVGFLYDRLISEE